MQNSQSLTYKYTFWHSKRREHEVFHITQPTLQGTSVPRKTDWEMLFSEFGVYYMDVRAGLWRKLSAEELMLLNCGAGEDSCESLGLQTSPGCSLEGLMLRLKFQYFGHLMRRVESHWKRPWCWEGLGAGGEGDDRGWDGWMASPTRCTWVWVNSRSWWWTGRPGLLRFMGSQRVGHDWAAELNWTELNW